MSLAAEGLLKALSQIEEPKLPEDNDYDLLDVLREFSDKTDKEVEELWNWAGL